MSWLFGHRYCIFLGWIVSADVGCAGSRRNNHDTGSYDRLYQVNNSCSDVVIFSRMNSQCGRWVCWKSSNTRWKSGLIRNTPGIISTFARCNRCVLIIQLSIRYNVCACRSSIYCCLSGTTCVPVIFQYITTSLFLLSTWYTVSYPVSYTHLTLPTIYSV